AEGVLAVDLDVFRFKRAEDRAGRGGDGAVQPRLLVGPGELVWVADATDLRITNVRFPGREGP
ncbi:MAG: hypothetical protein GWN71_32215, partial [Gammaproteobacteria bacterium]|nr:hypothetical protein [Gemmatimonadota bacterium]NIU78052.1 hypothetical protein [Gammaproteobacteria bacterium]NIX41451.1 hypothetical protein [Gemmatimonadota bacterium]